MHVDLGSYEIEKRQKRGANSLGKRRYELVVSQHLDLTRYLLINFVPNLLPTVVFGT
jgi:hypothetical protein